MVVGSLASMDKLRIRNSYLRDHNNRNSIERLIMASKSTSNRKTVANGVTVKYVKRASMWVVTYPKAGKNMQQWFGDKPTEEQINKIKEK